MKAFVVQLPNYEGPLDLLLSIVRRNELSIADLPLSALAAQYLAYLQKAEGLNVNDGMDWIEMATRLIQWKAASLLPADPALPDPAAALAQGLRQELTALNHSQLDQAKAFLLDRSGEGNQSWNRYPPPLLEEPTTASLWTIRKKAQAVRDLLRKLREQPSALYELAGDSGSVEEMREVALLNLQTAPTGVWFSAHLWFTHAAVPSRQIALFLALLELVRTGILQIRDDSVAESLQLRRLPIPASPRADRSTPPESALILP